MKKLEIKNKEIFALKDENICEQSLLNIKIKNIKQSVQRINNLISQIKEISDKPQK
ncbi:hypothetical protein [Fluviispira multicolorata]|uniref:hypothetical protein n=1 Tax=Fluviispira multicolorata TaxID=2654512 RepID=UPI00137574D6|nr:hypothetical protein [Fluviispira multicolorata]